MCPSSKGPARGSAAFRALLRLYPRDFRDEYGREMTLVFADRYRAAGSVAARARLWREAAAGVLVEAPKEHVRTTALDVRHALRALRQGPLFAATVIATLALGIGANTAIFQLIDTVRLRSLPVADPHELVTVRIAGTNRGFGITEGHYAELTRPMWHELQRGQEGGQEAFAGLFAWFNREVVVGADADLRRIKGLEVSSDFFRVLGVQPWRGRLLDARDETACPAPTAVISHSYWQRELGGRDLGPRERIRLDGEVRELVGVTPPRFFGLVVGEQFDVAVPMCREASPARHIFNTSVMGRLAPGWNVERTSARLRGNSRAVMEAVTPANYGAEAIAMFKGFTLEAHAAASGVSDLRGAYDRSLWLLLATTSLVLLIACANLTNLLLARAAARQREVAVRLALGASRFALVRQMAVECGVLAAAGAACGVVLAQVLSRALVAALSTQANVLVLDLEPSWRVLLFTAAVATATCLVFGVVPGLRATRIDASAAMRAGSRGTADRGGLRLQRALVVTQMATSLVLLVGALLFLRSFHNLTTFDPGLRQDGIVFGYLGFSRMKLPPERFNDVQRELVAALQSVPGVDGAATTSRIPLMGGSWGHGVTVGTVASDAKFTWVGPDYFRTMGIPLLQGRGFALSDTRQSARVAVVNQTFVRRFVPDGQAIGKELTTSPEPRYPRTTYEIVGVIPDTKYNSLRGDIPPMVFAPDSQHPAVGPWAAVVIHANVAPAATVAAVKRRLAQTHPMVLSDLHGLQARVRDGLVRERLLAVLSGVFGGLAALLAMVGLYGMMSYMVAQRRQEIGVRVALGAERLDIVSMVMRDAASLLAIGLLGGGAISLVVSRSAGALLFGLVPHDPVTLAASAVLLAGVAAAAGFLPARRASRVDPVTALRQE